MVQHSLFDKQGHLKIPEGLQEKKMKKQRKEEMQEFLSDFSKKIDFNPTMFIKNMTYVGFCISKRNKYYIYHATDYYLITTGIKTKTNYNIILESEVNEINQFIKNTHHHLFSMNDILNNLKTHTGLQTRINTYIQDYKEHENETDQRKYLYGLILDICYILVAQGELHLSKRGKEIIFQPKKHSIDKTNHIFKNLQVIQQIDNMLLLKDNRFYYTLQYKNMRGSIFPYLINEIEYLSQLIKDHKRGQQIQIIDLIQRMDYQQRFNEIYNMIIAQNLRNQREKTDYFKSRIKAALKIIKVLKKNIRIDKDGRELIFTRC